MSLREQLSAWARSLKSDVPAVFLAMKDSRTPLLAKVLAGTTVIYALSPVDLIPDFIPVLGYLDDVLLLPMLVAAAIKLIPTPVWEDCRRRAEGMWANGKPMHWYYALPMVIFWIVLILLVATAL